MKASLKLVLGFLIVSNAIPNSTGQFGGMFDGPYFQEPATPPSRKTTAGSRLFGGLFGPVKGPTASPTKKTAAGPGLFGGLFEPVNGPTNSPTKKTAAGSGLFGGLFGPVKGPTISPTKKTADGSGLQAGNSLAPSNPFFNFNDYVQSILRNSNISSTSTSKTGLFDMMAMGVTPTNSKQVPTSSETPAYPEQVRSRSNSEISAYSKVSQQENFDARLNQLETVFRQKIEEIKEQTMRNGKAQDEKIEELKVQLSRSTKAQNEANEEIKLQTNRNSKAQDDKIEELKAQLSRSTKNQDEKIEEIKTQTSRNSKDQDEKIAIIRVRERNLAQLLNQTREEMTDLKTQNRVQSRKTEELEQKLSIQNIPPALMKPDTNKKFTGMPTNCNDLSQIGHSLNGFYSVRGQGSNKRKNKIETIFCNFLGKESTTETRIGYLDIKHSEGVLFILKESKITGNWVGNQNTRILFAKEEINTGGGMKFNAAVFTAPRSGLYQFHYSDYYSYSEQVSTPYDNIFLMVNQQTTLFAPILPAIKSSQQPFSSPQDYDGSPVNLYSLLMLKAGDRVELVLVNRGNTSPLPNQFLSRFARYSGRLIEEELNF